MGQDLRRGAARAGGPGGTPLSSLTTYISVPVASVDGLRYAVEGATSKGPIFNTGIGEEVENQYAEKGIGRV